MQPQPSPSAPSEPLVITAETVLAPPSALPILPASPGVSGTTSDTVTPVAPDGGTQPVNPVNEGIQPRLPETQPDSIPDGIMPKTFKLPVSTVQSMERVVQQVNESLQSGQEPWSVHRYGVDTLNNHEIGRRAIAQAVEFAEERNVLRQANQLVLSQLATERAKNADLTAQLKQATDYIARLDHQPTPAVTPPPAPAVVADPAQETYWQQQYEAIRGEMAKTLKKLDAVESESRPVNDIVRALPSLIASLCVEAAKNSWYTQEYYQWYFHQLIAPYLPTMAVTRQ